MQLTAFIRKNKRVIIDEWEKFAATLLPAARDLNQSALRDHVEGSGWPAPARRSRPQTGPAATFDSSSIFSSRWVLH